MPAPITLRLAGWQYSRGCRHGLSDPTATVRVVLAGMGLLSAARIAAVRAGVARLAADEPIAGLDPADWPSSFGLGEGRPERPEDWLVALAVLVQRLARSPVGPGAVVGCPSDAADAAESDAATLALPGFRQSLVRESLVMAARWLTGWCRNDDASLARLRGEFDPWLERVQKDGVKPNSMRFAAAARALGVPVAVHEELLRFGWGAGIEWLDSSFTGRTGTLATRLARDKRRTLELLADAGIPVPPGALVRTLDAARKAAGRLGWPVVVKPNGLDQGVGVVTGIRTDAALAAAWENARRLGKGAVIVERHVSGADHRLLVVDGSLLRAARRTPGGIVGNGRATIAEAIAEVNTDPRRGTGKRSLMMRLALDDEARDCLAEQGLKPDDVPAPGRFVWLRRTANISTGGMAEDVTAIVHPDNRLLAERAARVVGLDIVGVDLLCPDIARSWREVGGAICELNAQPGFRPHWLDERGGDVNREILLRLYRGRSPTIPVVAVLGGLPGQATAFAASLHAAWRACGVDVSLASRAGLWLGARCVDARNAARFGGAQALLVDPAVQAAVVELDLDDLARNGHACQRYACLVLLSPALDADARTRALSQPAAVLSVQLGPAVASAIDAATLDAVLHAVTTEVNRSALPS